MSYNVTLCMYCKHFKNDGSWTCSAFPNGIPDKFIFDGEFHLKSVKGDKGIIFDGIDKYSKEIKELIDEYNS